MPFVASLVFAAGIAAAAAPAYAGQRGAGSASPEIQIGQGTGAITGVVVDATTQKPIPAAVVSIAGPPDAPGAPSVRGIRQIADESGRFAFTKLPAGIGYQLGASAFGYFDGGYGRSGQGAARRRIRLADGQWFPDAKIELERPSAISGTIIDEAGEPVVGVVVRAYAEIFVAGVRQIASSVLTTTDDRGAYRLGNLPAGKYLVFVPSVQHAVPATTSLLELSGTTTEAVAAAATAGRESPIRRDPSLAIDASFRLILGPYPAPPPAGGGRPQAYPGTFYPAARSLANAEAITLQAGDDRPHVDLQLRPLQVFRVSGRLDGPAEAVAGMTLRLMDAGSETLDRGSEAATALVAPDGRFTFLNVPAGAYTILANRSIAGYTYPSAALTGVVPRTPGSRGQSTSSSAVFSAPSGTMFRTETAAGSPRYGGRQAIVVDDGDLTDVVVPVRPGATLSGRVVVEQTKPNPNAMPLMMIAALPADGDPTLGQPQWMRRSADPTSEFTIEGLLAGEYLLRVVGGGVVKSITWDGKDYTHTPFDTTEGRDITGVVVTLTDQTTRLSGVARDAAGQPAANAAVFCFPVERAQWRNFGIQPARMDGVPTSTAGEFAVRSLPAGDYYLVAVEGAQIDRWKDPAFLEAASRVATRVSIAWGETKTQDLVLQIVKEGPT